MLQKLRKMDSKGFTLIELMIVIAIIGILAAIAIPNFIAYRNKSFCSAAEADANGVAADIADYFAIPTHVSIATTDVGYTATGSNTFVVGATAVNTLITITITDGSGRCPADYRDAMTSTLSPTGYWSGSTYIKLMQP